jgi:hypothetical protein
MIKALPALALRYTIDNKRNRVGRNSPANRALFAFGIIPDCELGPAVVFLWRFTTFALLFPAKILYGAPKPPGKKQRTGPSSQSGN